jgi:hypothetical protein
MRLSTLRRQLDLAAHGDKIEERSELTKTS